MSVRPCDRVQPQQPPMANLLRLTVAMVIVHLLLAVRADAAEPRADWLAHRPLEVPEHRLNALVRLGDRERFNETLAHILVPRVVGTPGHAAVRQYIWQQMESLGWLVEGDRFDEATPNLGVLTFENVIATLHPAADRHLVLACHYDSKYFAAGPPFMGASDSAVPCAMLIDLARALHAPLAALRSAGGPLGVRLVFFDGEEAFVEWSASDSVYGARHLAQRWQDEGRLEQIDMLVLLDLLGLPDPQFYSLFRDTEPWYARFVDIEQRLAQLDLIERDSHSGVVPQSAAGAAAAYFSPQSYNALIEDDHVPFMRRGVPIVHLIPLPFPDEWHTPADDWPAIDPTTVDNLGRVMRVFVAEYLHLDVGA